MTLLNTYCEFKDVLYPAAKKRMEEDVLAYANGLARRDLGAVRDLNNENHLLNWKVIYLLADQEFSVRDPSAPR